MSGLPIVAVVGATASGKSDLALDVAERLGGEVVNTDAMQVYRGMDIGTAKLPVAERRGIPHHLLDLLDVTEPATVAQFQTWAREVIADCRTRGVVPVLVGGSALYARAILDDFSFPATDAMVRARYETRLAEIGAEALYEELAVRAPEAAARMTRENGRRIVRALEALDLTGSWTAELPEPTYLDPHTVQIGVDIDRQALDERIARRVELMWEAGFVEEVRRLDAEGLREGVTASRAIGYSQVLAFLDGELSEDEAREKTVSGTRRFARRQDGWFRKDERIRWVRYDAPDRVDVALSSVREVAQ